MTSPGVPSIKTYKERTQKTWQDYMHSPKIIFKLFSVRLLKCLCSVIIRATSEVIFAEGSHKVSRKNSQGQGYIWQTALFSYYSTRTDKWSLVLAMKNTIIILFHQRVISHRQYSSLSRVIKCRGHPKRDSDHCGEIDGPEKASKILAKSKRFHVNEIPSPYTVNHLWTNLLVIMNSHWQFNLTFAIHYIWD